MAVWDGEEVAWGVREVDKIALEVALPAWARMNTGLRLPVLFVFIKAPRPIGGRRFGGRRGNGRVRRGRKVCAFEGQIGIGGKRGDRWRWCDEILDLLCMWWDH
jgi:hypothetical protein